MDIRTAQAVLNHLQKNKMAFCFGEQGQFYTIGEVKKVIQDHRGLDYPVNMFYQSEAANNLIICKRCGLEQVSGTREATRDFVYSDICIKCMQKENE